MKTISVDCLCCRKYGKQNVETHCYLHTDLSDPEISTIHDDICLPTSYFPSKIPISLYKTHFEELDSNIITYIN